jgi:hypothetical protein
MGAALLGLSAVIVLGCSALGGWVAYSVAGLAPGLAPGPAPARGPGAAEQPGAPVVTLTTTPTGAEVWEDGVRLGTTPLELPADPDRAHTFELKLDGWLPTVVSQPPTTAPARVDTTLTPVHSVSSAAPASAPAGPAPPSAVPAPAPASPAQAAPAPHPAPTPVAGPVPIPVKTPIMMER